MNLLRQSPTNNYSNKKFFFPQFHYQISQPFTPCFIQTKQQVEKTKFSIFFAEPQSFLLLWNVISYCFSFNFHIHGFSLSCQFHMKPKKAVFPPRYILNFKWKNSFFSVVVKLNEMKMIYDEQFNWHNTPKKKIKADLKWN